MRRPGGYAIAVDPERGTTERDTFTCKHCNCIVFVQPKQDPSEMGGFCQLCCGHICKGCSSEGSCTPFEKKLEAMEARGRFLEAVRNG